MATDPVFVAFLREPASLAVVQEQALAMGGAVQEGGVAEAVSYLNSHAAPPALIVEIPSAEEAPALLDQLADVCPPTTRVIVCGPVNEYSFYSWLIEIGIAHYLLQPFQAKSLHAALQQPTPSASAAAPAPVASGKVTAMIGARGGVGTTVLAANLAHMLAMDFHRKTMLIDTDVHFGTVAMAFDLEPSRGLRELYEHPERVDGLFLERMTGRAGNNLSILSAEESLDESIASKAQATDVLLDNVFPRYDSILIDLPRKVSPLIRSVVERAEHTIIVTELNLLGLRDVLRLSDLVQKTLKRPAPLVVANRVGMVKGEMSRADFEKHSGIELAAAIPYLPEAYIATAQGDMLSKHVKADKLKELKSLAKLLAGAEKGATKAAPVKRPFFARKKEA